MITRAAMEAAAAAFAARGYPRDYAIGRAMQDARPRMDVQPGPGAQMLLYQLALARKHETVARRRRMPTQKYPRGIEAQYAARLVGIVQGVRPIYARLMAELPKLLARAIASRVDAVESAASRAAETTDYHAMVDGELERRTVAGLEIAVEYAAGSERKGRLMRYAYGFIVGAIGADGEDLDVFIGPEESPLEVYVIHQNNKHTEFLEYDEDKVMLGWASADDAKAAYLAQYDDPRFFRGMTVFSLEEFTARLRRGDADGEMLAHRADSGEFEFARRLIAEAGEQVRTSARDGSAEKLATFFARETSQANRRELSKQLKAGLGIDVLPDDRYIPQTIEYFTAENAALIGSVPEDLHRDIAQLTARAFSKRMTPETFGALLEERFEVAENRARFIARDQLGKLWGQVNAVRQRGLGIDEYWWRTQGDSLVRATHRALHNKRMRYDEPPSFGLPGEDFGCRCGADPVVEQLLERAEELAAHTQPVDLAR